MHKAHNVIETALCVRGDGLPEGGRELDQYLDIIVSASHLQTYWQLFTFSSLPNDIESIADAMRGCR